MRHQVLVRKYAQGMVQALKGDREYESVLASLNAFLGIYRQREDLRAALASPFLNGRRKAALLEAVAARAGVRGKALRLLGLLLANKRLDLFPAVVEILPEVWHEKLGVRTFGVVSAVPLTDAQKGRLGARVEAWQKAPVRLVYTVDPGIVGGLALRRGHVVYDVSVRGQLERFQETVRDT